ncbi:MAG: IS630 family transposase, partial [Chloroflexota bacterium]|nr:IS630 family transposase [Chloroflexota bacterium]
MPRSPTVAPHLSTDELATRYRAAKEGGDRTHWQVLWLVARGRTCPAVAETVGYTVNWVRTIVTRDNADGPQQVGDGRRANPGAKPLLDAAGKAALRDALGGPAPD